jgi:hypothetical protein
VWATGVIGAGLFDTDPVNGYPIGTPDKIVQPTWHGTLHDLCSLISFLVLPFVFFLMSFWFAKQRKYRWMIYTVLTVMVFIGAFVLSNLAFSQAESLVPFGGLFQRIAIIAGLGWLSMLALYFLRASPFREEKN